MVLVFLILLASASATYVPGSHPKCGKNETAVACKTICPPQSCNISYTTYSNCNPKPKCVPGCDCIENYLRTNDGVCVLNDDCPPPPGNTENPTPPCKGPSKGSSSTESSQSSSYSSSSSAASSSSSSSSSSYSSNKVIKNGSGGSHPKCGKNETAVACKTICPPQSCNISYTTYSNCNPKPKCVPGCDCIENYLRTNEGVCVLNDDCPPPGSTVNPKSPSQGPPKGHSSSSVAGHSKSSSYSSSTSASSSSSSSSSSSYSSTKEIKNGCGVTKPQCGKNETAVPCKTICSPQFCNISYTDYVCDKKQKCIPGCDCIKDYLRNNDGVCISNKECPGPDLVRDCSYNKCTPTCSLPYPQNCPPDSNPCNCPQGYLVSEEGGQCVPREECQKYANCKGDYNATYVNCPIGCPSTCAKPDAEYCNVECGSSECACDPGYILSKKDGQCIKPDDCPGGYPCKQNETFVGCLIRCPNIYCPVDDNRGILICDPARNCPSGCGCKRNYLRKSVNEYKCILASECPPVNCNRQFEEWNPCPEPCFSDRCRDRNKVSAPGDCRSSGPDCRPQCVCKEGYYRNGTEICVTAKECPPDNQY